MDVVKPPVLKIAVVNITVRITELTGHLPQPVFRDLEYNFVVLVRGIFWTRHLIQLTFK